MWSENEHKTIKIQKIRKIRKIMKNIIKFVMLALFATMFSSCVRFVPMGQAGGIRPMWEGQQGQNQQQYSQERYLKGVNVTKTTPKNTDFVQIFCYPKRGAGLTVDLIHNAEDKTLIELSKNSDLDYTGYAKKLLSGLYNPQKDFLVKTSITTTKQQKTVFVPENEVSSDIKSRF
jgi:hypothetical protein